MVAPFLLETPKVAAPPVMGKIPPRLTICSVTLVAEPQPVTPATSTVRTSKNAMVRLIMVPPGYRFVVCGYRSFTESPVVASPPSTNANRPCRGDFCKAGFVRYVGAVRHVRWVSRTPVSYTHLRAHETRHDLVCRLLLEKKKKKKQQIKN